VSFTKEIAPNAGDIVGASFRAQPFSGTVDFGCNAACKFYPIDGGISDAGPFLDVGTITATDVTSGAQQALMDVDAIYFSGALIWTAGDVLQVAGGGGAFPAFSISLQSSSPLTVTSPPEIAAGGTVLASQGAGLTVTWQPASPPATFMTVGILSSAGQINCAPADSAGTMTISPSLLANIPVGTYAPGQGLTIGRWNTAVDAFSGKNIGIQVEEFIGVAIQVSP